MLESESCLWFNRVVAADSSGLALRQQGDSSRSSIWVLHSCRPYTLPSQRSRDTTARQPQLQTESLPVPQLQCGVWETCSLSSELWPERRMVAQKQITPSHSDDGPLSSRHFTQKTRKRNKGAIQCLWTQGALSIINTRLWMKIKMCKICDQTWKSNSSFNFSRQNMWKDHKPNTYTMFRIPDKLLELIRKIMLKPNRWR